jgi:hypothetical protein
MRRNFQDQRPHDGRELQPGVRMTALEKLAIALALLGVVGGIAVLCFT